MLDLDPVKTAQGLSTVRPMFGRSEIRKGKITVLQDYYNANPDSMGAAIEFLRQFRRTIGKFSCSVQCWSSVKRASGRTRRSA